MTNNNIDLELQQWQIERICKWFEEIEERFPDILDEEDKKIYKKIWHSY